MIVESLPYDRRGRHSEIHPDEISLHFWSRVAVTANDDKCWEWKLKGNPKGYGIYYFKKGQWLAHRFAYYLANGRIFRHLLVLHSCDNPCCCNPKHLRQGTHKDNGIEAGERGLLKVGEKCNFATVTEIQVREIKRKLTEGYRPYEIEQMLNISRQVIYPIKQGKNWKHVTLDVQPVGQMR